MKNNYYNNTINHQQIQSGSTINSHLVRYDKPHPILIGCGIYDMHAMVITTICRPGPDSTENIYVCRTPLTGFDLQPWGPYDAEVDLLVLPQDRILTPPIMRKYFSFIEKECCFEEALDELKNNGFQLKMDERDVEVVLSRRETVTYLSSPWFNLKFENGNKNWCHPLDIINLCRFSQLFNKTIGLKMKNPDDEKESILYRDVCRLLLAFKEHNFIQYGKVYNDGTYTYSSELGRIEMTRKEFLEKFPKAWKVIDNI